MYPLFELVLSSQVSIQLVKSTLLGPVLDMYIVVTEAKVALSYFK